MKPSWTLTRSSSSARDLDLTDLCSRVCLAGLYSAFAWRLTQNFIDTARFTSLLMLTSELLVAVMTTFRRQAVVVDRTMPTRAVTAVSVIGPLCVRPISGTGMGDMVTTAIVIFGLAVIIAGQLSLGRSFGVIPANRGVVVDGLYAYVRHPIYMGYLIVHVGFLLANPTISNMLLLALADVALVRRALREERTLSSDPVYQKYGSSTRWRLVPGLF